MDFGKVLTVVTGFLDETGIRYGVIGGIALAAYGLPRTTLDLDFVVESRSQEDLIRFLEANGYQTLHRSSGYSNHKHPDAARGHLDFVYVNEDTGRQIFGGCRSLSGPNGLPMPVPRPEHLAAMKVAAMKNDPARTFQEMTDIRFLLTLPGTDRKEVKTYFDRHDLGDRFNEIERTL